MNIPVAAVRKMKRTFKNAKELHKFARLAGLPLSGRSTRQMWRGDFTDIGLEEQEAFWAMVGYRLVLEEDKRL